MTNDGLYHVALNGRSIWITLIQPAIFIPEKNQYEKSGWICAFKIGDEPRMIDGEYVSDDGKIKFFKDQTEALCAAQAAARKKVLG